MRAHVRPALLALLALLAPALPPGAAPTARASDAATATGEAALLEALGRLRLGEGLVADPVILFPLIIDGPPPVVEVAPALGGAVAAFEEPGRSDRVRVSNVAETPALLLGGTVVAGGHRDRVVREDVLLPVGGSALVGTVPGAMAGDRRREAADFKVADFLAPPYLRESALFRSGAATVASKFVSHFLEFRNEGDRRRSLAAIGASDVLAEHCLPCQRSMAQWPDKRESGFVVGGIAVIRGRVQSVDAFANNTLLVAWFSPLLKSLSFPSAAIAARAKKAGIPLPGGDDPTAVLALATTSARSVVAGLLKARITRREVPAGAIGEAFTLALPDGARGTALLHDGHLLHLALFPGDPFEYGLYALPLSPLDPEDLSGEGAEDAGVEAQARRARIGARLTEFERRLLERLREPGGLR